MGSGSVDLGGSIATLSGVPVYLDFASLPVAPPDGTLGVTTDTDTLWIYDASTPAWKSLGNTTSPNIIQVSKTPSGSGFTSIAAALASISGASESNQFLVHVAPGIYTEPLLVIPSFTSLIGSSAELTHITPDTANHDVIQITGDFIRLAAFDVEGGGVGYAAISVVDAGSEVDIRDIELENCGIGLLVKSVTTDFTLTAENMCFKHGFNLAVKVESTAGFKAELVGYDFLIIADAAHSNESILVTGAGTELHLFTPFLRGNEGTDVGVKITNGGYFAISGGVIEDNGIGVWADTVGVSPTVELDGVDFDDNAVNVKIENTTAIGRMVGYTDYTKQIINFSSEFFIANKDALSITVAKKGGDYSSVAAAVAGIADASAAKPYEVLVGAGVFVEPTIVMKSYVTVRGSGNSTTILQAADPAQPVIQAVALSEVNNCKITGSTSSGAHAIYHERQVADPFGVFFLKDCVFENNYIHFHSKSSVAATNNRIDGCRVVDSDTCNTVFLCEATNSFQSGLNITNFLMRDFMSPYPVNFMKITGPGAVARILASTIRAAGTGKAFWLADSAELRIYSSEISGFDYGIFTENAGAAPDIHTLATDVVCVTYDLKIDHPGTTGHFQGACSKTKTSVTPDNFRLSILDPNPGAAYGSVVLGDIGTGHSFNKLYNFTLLGEKSATLGLSDGGMLSKGAGLSLNVAAGQGFYEDASENIQELTWSSTSISIPASSARYVYFNNSGNLSLSASIPNLEESILLGRATSNATDVEYVEQTPMLAYHASNFNATFLREALGPIFKSGSIVSEVGTRTLQVGAGVYFFANKRFAPSGGNPITFDAYFGGADEVEAQTVVSNTQYDNAGTLTALTASYYAKHSLYLSGEGADEEYILVYSQAEYSTLPIAQGASIPVPPSFVQDSIALIATIIVQQGTTNLVEIRDERPRLGFKASGVSGVTVHGDLSGLSADDHAQYLLISGSRAMSGGLNMGSNNITSAGTYNSVTVEGHAARHLPNGADSLATAAPVENLDSTTTNAVGIQNSLARSDHAHAISTGAASTQTPDQTNAAGSSANLAKADHVHTVPTAAAVTLDASTTNTQGAAATFARSNHTHAITTGGASSQTPDQSNAAGSSANIARADHVHNIATAVPINQTIAASVSQGTAASFARSDHGHTFSTTVAATQTPNQTNAAGTSTSFARADHVHNIPTAAPSSQTPDQSNADGVATTFSKADHIHNIPTAAASGLNASSTSTQGTAASFARADHTHAVASGVVSTQNADQSNAAGTSTNFARADHIHNIPTAVPSSTGAANAQGSSTSFSKADHVHATVITNGIAQSVTPDSRSAGTDALMVGMTLTPAAGTYQVFFEGMMAASVNGVLATISVYSGGSQVVLSTRTTNLSNARIGSVAANTQVTVNGSQAIEVQWSVTGGSATINGRSLSVIRVG